MFSRVLVFVALLTTILTTAISAQSRDTTSVNWPNAQLSPSAHHQNQSAFKVAQLRDDLPSVPRPLPSPAPRPRPMPAMVTEETGTMTDQQGNVYQTVKIGNQWWMAENLKVTHYRNGDPIPNVTDNTEWSNLSSGAYAAFDNDGRNVGKYGYLYNWHAVNDARNIAPVGWRVPTDEEWQTLIEFLGGRRVAGGKMKQAGGVYWNHPNAGATNDSGFTALPGGRRDHRGLFDHLGRVASFWSSTEHSRHRAWHMRLSHNNANATLIDNPKGLGCSIRLVKDTQPQPTLTAIEISPSLKDQPIVGAGKSLQITLTAVYSDQSRQDATAASTWSVSPSAAGRIDANGIYRASSSFTGQVMVEAGYRGRTVGVILIAVPEVGTMTDIDGNVYRTVRIGNQWWMADNLRVTRYPDGSPIRHETDQYLWADPQILRDWQGLYSAYDNDEKNAQVYGYLYNLSAARSIAPEGWRLPTDGDWKTLERHLGMSSSEANKDGPRGTNEGGKLKARGWTHWKRPNRGALNLSGFSALPGGYRHEYQGFFGMGEGAYFWTGTTEYVEGNGRLAARNRILRSDHARVERSRQYRSYGFSVRLVKE